MDDMKNIAKTMKIGRILISLKYCQERDGKYKIRLKRKRITRRVNFYEIRLA